MERAITVAKKKVSKKGMHEQNKAIEAERERQRKEQGLIPGSQMRRGQEIE